MLKNISLVRCAHLWNIFQHEKRNFVSPRSHVYILLPSSLKDNLCFWGIKNDNNDDNGFINSTSTWWLLLSNSNQLKSNNGFWGRGKRKNPETSFKPRVHQSRPHSLLFFWSAPRTRTQATSKTGSPQITDFPLVYARSEFWNNSGCQRLQKRTFPTTAHKLEVARIRVLGADQEKSGLWGRDCVFTLYKDKFDTT